MAPKTRLDPGTASQEELAFKGAFSSGQRGNLRNVDSNRGAFSNGQWGNLRNIDSDRSASFRDGNDSQMFISDTSMLQGSSTFSRDSDPFAQYLKLDPITTGGQKYTSLNDLKRVLGISPVNTLGDCAFQTGNPKSRIPADPEDLKRFKARLQEASARASYGSKKLDESVHKLNKHWEAVNSNKQFQNEGLRNERMRGSHLSNMGSQTHQSITELANNKPEDIPNKIIPNTHISTSAVEIQAEGQNNSFSRQPLTIGKDKDNIKDVGKVCDGVQEKVQRLLVSEETWDRKMKRKHSMGTDLAGSTDGEGELKSFKYLKQASMSGLRSCDSLQEKIQRLPISGETWDRKMKRKHSMGTVLAGSTDGEGKPKKMKRKHFTGTTLAGSTDSGLQSCDAIGLRSRRPLMKKSHNSKDIAHLGHPSTSSSPNIAGMSGDDKEELLFAANFASNASYTGCSSSFWKKMEPNFAPANLEVIGHLKQQVKTIEDDQSYLSQKLCLQSDAPDGIVLTNNLFSQYPLEGERGRNILNQSDSKELSSMFDMVDQPHDGSFLSSQMDLEYKLPPLYRRVLTALIIDDQTEETVGDENIYFLHERDDPPVGSYTETVSCNGNATFTCDEVSMEDKLLMELQSVGIYPEPVPELADEGCEAIDQEITQLQKGSCLQFFKKKEGFMKFNQAVEDARELEQRALEQVAMEKLVELAYKKKLASRGTIAAKYGISKISRPVALAFTKRNLTRCQTFEETRKSCFLDPMFKDVLYTTPALDNYTVSTVAVNRPLAQNSRQDFAPPGSFPFREQNVLGNSNHPSNLDFARTGPILNGGKKGKVLPDNVGASAYLGEKKGEVLLDDDGASDSLGGKKGKVLLDDVGASALEGQKEKVLLDDIGASASLGGKKGEVLLDGVVAGVGPSASLGGEKGEVLLDDVGASASLGEKREVLLDDVGVDARASLGGKKGEVLLASASLGGKKGVEDVGASATLGNSFLGGTMGKRSKRGKKREVLLDDVGASASFGGKKGEVLLDGVGVSASLGSKKGEVLLDGVRSSASMGEKREEVLLDDVDVDASASLGGNRGEGLVASASLGGKKGVEDVGASANLGNSFLGGTTGKRSKRGTGKDTSMRNYVKRGGHSSASNTRSERKTKVKAKPQTDGLSTSAKGSLSKLVGNTNSKHQLACGSDQLVSSGNNNVGSLSHGYSSNDFAIETEDPLDLTNMPELDSIGYGVDKDLDSWLNICGDALEDDDEAVGLDIPMDDLFTVL
ncbi:unnamed protein product [Lathyrus oleraceus]|uniref:Uncharacterized protein n=1 Tax=Pisum sativum TaxID=3888 RepID=A0A9D4WNN5_PEA|nr:uncharacterized protein LOC127079098 isoform X2 [Pisum sativum]KAI5404912.1 hypothetical protein KIW84_051897 [Pisum sativum]